MTANDSRPPVHESLSVVEHETIYQNDEWWKAVVQYRYEDAADSEVAIYLWHHDDEEWNRKNKYVVKTPEAWHSDSKTVDALIMDSPPSSDADPDLETRDSEFPVSEYYTVAAGKTVFKTEEWWKAIVNISEKGDWETNEVMIYVWQQRDGDWRRQQKYTIKSQSKWEEEEVVVDSILEGEPKRQNSTVGDSEEPEDTETEALETLSDEIDKHLSADLEGS
ncbi:hypothetical protein [Haloarchaeobius litoreus]|uniref:Uncharacterized protein n=1 Tax=Haloarchaeobius litoreus TaxID=755306 RepID=A0ABD6DL27_9EURY|nr:hypothetical protein [Haloarchaeobius litoreus]